MVDWSLLAAPVVGAALAVSGATLQSVLRNPLAEPYLLGTVGGAALFTVIAMNLGLTALGAWVLPAASFLGSCFSLALVCAIAHLAARERRREGADPALRSSGSTVVLAGFITAGFTGSLEMLALAGSDAETYARLTKWLFGTLSAATGFSVAIGAVVLFAVLAGLLCLSKWLDVVELGRDEAECLGVNSSLVIFAALAAVSLMTAVSVAMAGAIGFLGLVVPHFVRRLTGPRMRRVLPWSAVAGGVFLILAESLGRLWPADVSVGVVCAIVGSPVFFHMLIRRHNGEGWDV